MPQSTDGLGGGFEQWDESMDPITGEGFREWSDALRDVEELLGDPELRWQATEIRNSARDMRSEFKRHSAEPTWSEVEDLIADPLRKLQRTVSEELLRRVADKSAIVPIDRDPVPAQFSGAVQEYFENLGKGQ